MHSYAQMEAQLFARARSGMKLGLERMERALAELGHPERCAPSFHVAGTNGKGSVCAFLDAACRAAGLRTGLYTSPHLETFGERFQVDGVPASESDLLALYVELEARIPWAFEGPDSLTFFELVTLIGFLHFARSHVDVLVVEVGLGGLLDATNVIAPVVACITPIGFDHQEYLGNTLAAIAREKAGILKPGVPGVIAAQRWEARDVIDAAGRRVGAPLHHEGEEFHFDSRLTVGLRGAHQRSNAAVAWRALELAAHRGIIVPAEAARTGLACARWPGRLETVANDPEIVLDGAHNPPAAEVLAAALRELYSGRRCHLVVGMLADKDARAVLDILSPLATTLTFTSPTSPRAIPAETLAALAAAHPYRAVISSPMEAVEHARSGVRGDDVVVVCGSLYLVGEVRAALAGRVSGGPRENLRAGG